MKRSVAVQRPARLSVERAQLLIENDAGRHTVPRGPRDSRLGPRRDRRLGPASGELGEQRVAVVVCNAKHLPSAMLLPYEGHSLMAQTLRGQIEASKPAKKQIWRQIVVAKIQSQSRFLQDKLGHDSGLGSLSNQVLSGDRSNREAVAAGVYWDALFGGLCPPSQGRNGGVGPGLDPTFRTANALLNYGYAVLRAAVARAIVQPASILRSAFTIDTVKIPFLWRMT